MQGIEAGCDVVVSTDDPEIDTAMESLHRRPPELATDSSPIEDTIRAVLLEHKRYDAFVLLNPTTPFRRVEDIKLCLKAVTDNGFPSCTAVRRDYSYTVPEGAMYQNLNRQHRVPKMVVTGSIYAVSVPAFLQLGQLMLYGKVNRGTWLEVPPPYIDIDTETDWVVAQAVYNHMRGKQNVGTPNGEPLPV